MANCEDLITTDDLATAKVYAEKFTEFVESSNNTMTTPEGKDKLTITGAGNIAKETVSIAVSSAGYTIVGDFSDSSKVTITSENQVYTSKLVSGSEDALWRTNQVLPYTPTGADPTSVAESGKWVVVAQGELKSIARSLNVLNTQVIYSTDTTTVLDDVLYIYNASTQVTYGMPELSTTGETIVSVSGSELTTSTADTYTLIGIDCCRGVFYASNYKLETLLDFKNIQNDIIASGQLNVKLVFSEQTTIVGSAVSGVTLSGLSSFVVEGLDIVDTYTYGAGEHSTLFNLENVKYVEINGNVESTLPDTGTGLTSEKVSMTVVELNTCDNFIFNVNTTKLHRSYLIYNVKNVSVKNTNTDTMYPNLVSFGCGVLDIHSVNSNCRRDIFIYGATGGNIVIDSTDQSKWSLIKHYLSDTYPSIETSNLDIKYKGRGVSQSGSHGGRTSPISIEVNTPTGMVETPESAVRNITITYDVEADYGTIIGVIKQFNDESAGDNTPRGYVLQNIAVKGRFVSSVNGQGYYLGWRDPSGGGASWVSGDLVSNVSFRDLTVINMGGASGYTKVNLEQLVDAVSSPDHIIFNNVSSPDGRFNATDDFGDAVVFADSEFEIYTTKDSRSRAEATLIRRGWVNIPTGGIVQIATSTIYRTIVSVNIAITAYYDPDNSVNMTAGEFRGNAIYPTLVPASDRTAYFEDVTQGVAVNPELTFNDDGTIDLSFPEWSAQNVEVNINAEITYNQYTSPSGKNLKGLVLKAFSLTF